MRRSSSRFFLTTLTVWGLALLLSSSASAQFLRSGESPYVLLKGGATVYSGDLEDSLNPMPTGGFDDPGFGVGGEIGYLFNPNLSFGLGFLYHDLPIEDGIVFNGTDFDSQTQDDTAYQIQGLFRYSPLMSRISPYVELGGALVIGQGEEAARNSTPADDDVLGYGPVVGLGLDFGLTPQIGLMLGAQSTFVFPDAALDNADIGAFVAAGADQTEFDVLTTFGGGLRYALRSPVTPVEITRLDCPSELTQGDAGTFTAMTNPDATQPVSVSWSWGDGSEGAGMTASHTYRTPGTYTVTATALGDRNDDMEDCVVRVVEPQIAPVLSACRISPTQVAPNETVTFNGSVNSDANQPVSISVDWGDGEGDSGTRFPATHRYADVGTYTVRATAQNAYGDGACEATIQVVDTYCASVSEFNSVYFDFGSASLSATARELLDENIEQLQRCPDLCVLIRAYTDDRETDQIRLSQRRADAIRDYYTSQGVDISRLRAEGLGPDPSANSKEDPGVGDSRARRGDSIPATCGTFTPRR